MMILDSEDIADYILENYTDKIVEVGIGNHPYVALLLKDELELIATDVNDQKHSGIRFCKDDIFEPNASIYKNASLIYSIRPPIDLQPAIAKVASESGSDLLIRPFGNEKAELGKYYKKYTIINYKKARFYLYKLS